MADRHAQLENAFGRIAIAHGLATAGQVEDALGAVKKLAELGMREKLGAIMVKKGYLTPGQVNEILEIQGQRAAHRIEGYKMISKLGQGAMGAVFKAKQLSLDRIVALKILSTRFAKDESYIKRFLTEARSVARLNHPNIIQGIDVGESRGHYYFAMEFVDGVTLADILRDEGPIEEERALKIMEGIAEALDHAQKHGLIHRDVKPDNIMVTRTGDTKLCDLGLAKLETAEPSASSTGTGRVVGTPHYIAPEQARGDDRIDIRADIYSLGATLFHVLTGRTPYSGENPQVVMTKHLTDPVDDPRDIRPDISEGTALVIFKMMAKGTKDRYQTPGDLLKDIRTVLRGKVPVQLMAAFAGTRRLGRTTIEQRRVRARSISTRSRRSGVTGLLVTLGVVVVAGILAVKLSSSAGRPAPRVSPQTPARASPQRAGGRARPERTEGASELNDMTEADRAAKALYGEAARFAADPKNAQEYPEIFRRFRSAAAAAGKGSHYAEKAETALECHKKRQVNDRNKLILELREKARKLVRQGRFREAYALWGEFPKGLLPKSSATGLAILDSERKAVADAARNRLDATVKAAHAKAASGDYGKARSLLRDAERIGIREVTSRLPAERRRLEKAVAEHRGKARRRRAEAWETVWRDILALAEGGDYEGAQIMTREALSQQAFRAHLEELQAVEFDMKRLALRQQLAVEGLEAKIGYDRVVVHKDGRGYTGTVTKVEDGRVTLQPARPGTKPVVIIPQDLEPDDIKRHAPIMFSDPEGLYDYAILFIYCGQPKKAQQLLERCLASERFADRARRHLECIRE